MSFVTIIQHVEPEGPGAILEALDARGHEVRSIRIHERETVPPSIDGMAGLVVMGGPMGVHDGERHPHLAPVKRLMALAVDARVPLLGVCLGSQLLAAGLGATVRAGGRKEIGWRTVTLGDEASRDPLFHGVARTFEAFHWHGDVFDVPCGAVPLASSDWTPCQAFRWQDNAYGLLFHLEVDAASVTRMTEAFAGELADAGLDPRDLTADLTRRIGALRPVADIVFGRWAELIA